MTYRSYNYVSITTKSLTSLTYRSYNYVSITSVKVDEFVKSFSITTHAISPYIWRFGSGYCQQKCPTRWRYSGKVANIRVFWNQISNLKSMNYIKKKIAEQHHVGVMAIKGYFHRNYVREYIMKLRTSCLTFLSWYSCKFSFISKQCISL